MEIQARDMYMYVGEWEGLFVATELMYLCFFGSVSLSFG